MDELRTLTQVIIISDTYPRSLASPLMKKLNWPTIFCNSLEVSAQGEITGFKMRVAQSKLATVKALQTIGFETIASGDSYNDLGMIQASKAGFLLKAQIKSRLIIRISRHMRNLKNCCTQLRKYCNSISIGAYGIIRFRKQSSESDFFESVSRNHKMDDLRKMHI